MGTGYKVENFKIVSRRGFSWWQGVSINSIPSAEARNKIAEIHTLMQRWHKSDHVVVHKVIQCHTNLRSGEHFILQNYITHESSLKITIHTNKAFARQSLFVKRAGSEHLMMSKRSPPPWNCHHLRNWWKESLIKGVITDFSNWTLYDFIVSFFFLYLADCVHVEVCI